MCIRNVIDLKIYFLNKNDQINISHLQQSKQQKKYIYKKTQSTSSSNAKGIQIKNEKQIYRRNCSSMIF